MRLALATNPAASPPRNPVIRFLAHRPARLLPTLLLAAASIFNLHAQTSPNLICATDLTLIKQLDSPAFSPDGRQIVYCVRSTEENPEKPGEYFVRQHLWIATTDRSTPPRQLTRGDVTATQPAWHPKGTHLAFTRTIEGKPQIWILPVIAGGEAYPLTKNPGGARNPRWSPDGKSILFSTTLTLAEARRNLPADHPVKPSDWPDERPRRSYADTYNWPTNTTPKNTPLARAPKANPNGTLAERREWLAKNESLASPRVFTRPNFLTETGLQAQPEIQHLCLVPFDQSAPPIDLTPGPLSFEDASWLNTTSGLRILAVAHPLSNVHPDRQLERSLYSIATQSVSAPTLLYGDIKYNFETPLASPNAQAVALLLNDTRDPAYHQTEVVLLNLRTNELTRLTPAHDRTCRQLHWSPDGRHLYFTSADSGSIHLYRVPADGGPVERLTQPGVGIRAYDLHAEEITAIVTNPANPYELHHLDLTQATQRTLTTHNQDWIRSKSLSIPSYRALTRPDGLKIDVWIHKPTTYVVGRYPLLIEIHGGPNAMWGPGEPTLWHEIQYFAARGYTVAYCNPRGSGGYGRAFQAANYQNWGPGPAADVLAAADLAAKEPYVDTERQVITGGSYGGYLTTYILTQDQRFSAAIAQRGVYDLSVFYGEGLAWRLVPYHFGGHPWQPETRKLLDAQSPLLLAEKIRTPLLIKMSDNDHRVGLTQSQMLYKTLKELEHPVEYVRYPEGDHHLSRTGKPEHQIDRLVRFDEFFLRYLGPQATDPAVP